MVLENVKGLLDRHPQTLLNIIRALQGILDAKGHRYYQKVGYKILNSLTHGGLPQNRPRIYIVALRVRAKLELPLWPQTLKATPQLSKAVPGLGKILGPSLAKPLMPTAPVAKAKVLRALRQIAASGHDAQMVPVAINANAIKMTWHVQTTTCLTVARAKQGGFWVTSLGRFMSTSEMFRLQGIDPTHLRTDCVAQTALAGMIGNSFSQPIVELVLRPALVAGGFAPCAALRNRFA